MRRSRNTFLSETQSAIGTRFAQGNHAFKGYRLLVDDLAVR